MKRRCLYKFESVSIPDPAFPQWFTIRTPYCDRRIYASDMTDLRKQMCEVDMEWRETMTEEQLTEFFSRLDAQAFARVQAESAQISEGFRRRLERAAV